LDLLAVIHRIYAKEDFPPVKASTPIEAVESVGGVDTELKKIKNEVVRKPPSRSPLYAT